MSVKPEDKFERLLLASLMSNKEIFSKVLGILKPKYFKNERKEIFNLIKSHYQKFSIPGTFAEIEMGLRNLQGSEHRDKIQAEMESIKNSAIPESDSFVPKMCDETLKFVKDALYLEALEVGSEGLMLKDDSLKQKAEQILDERAKVNIDSDLGIEFSDATAVIDYYGAATNGIFTQHKSINDRLGPGILPGTLSLILAPSGVGKSLLMTDFISGWTKAGKNTLLVSLEMSAEEVMKRVHSNVLGIPMVDFEPAFFDRERFIRKLNEAKTKGCGTFYAKDYPAQSFSALQLESLVESFKNEKGLEFDVILVDYLGIMKSDLISPSAGLYSYIKSIAEELRASAKKLQVPVISASQLNRGAIGQTNADNAAVSDSLGSVMTADFLMFLLQTDEMKQNGDMIAKITKNRFSGRTETFPMKVDYTVMRFEDPEMPASIEERMQMRDIFEQNSAEAEKQLKEHFANDAESAKILDAANTGKKEESLSDVLNGLL